MNSLVSPAAWLSRLKALLGSFFNLFPLGGATGGIIVRQKGGTPGTNEIQIFEDGSNCYINGKQGNTIIGSSGGSINFTDGGAGSTAYRGANGGNFNVHNASSNNAAVYGTAAFTAVSGYTFFWNSSSTNVGGGGSGDTAISRAAPAVARMTDSSGTTVSWLQNTAGEAALANAFTDNTGTLTATNLSRTVIAGRSYRIVGRLIVSNSTAADGAQFDFNGGTASATAFDISASSNQGDVNTRGTLEGTALNTVLNYTAVTGTNRIWVSGYLKVNGAGTITLRAATNTTVSGTMTLAAGSWLALYDTVTV